MRQQESCSGKISNVPCPTSPGTLHISWLPQSERLARNSVHTEGFLLLASVLVPSFSSGGRKPQNAGEVGVQKVPGRMQLEDAEEAVRAPLSDCAHMNVYMCVSPC